MKQQTEYNPNFVPFNASSKQKYGSYVHLWGWNNTNEYYSYKKKTYYMLQHGTETFNNIWAI